MKYYQKYGRQGNLMIYCSSTATLKLFNCLQPVLSFSLAALIHWFTQSYCKATNAVTTMLILLLLCQLWVAEICICHKPHPSRDEMRDLQITPPRMLMLPFFSILPALHLQDTFVLVLNFEVGHFASHFFLPFGVAMKRIPPPVFYPAGDGC